MANRKSQLTLFIIFGIIVLFIFILLFYTLPKNPIMLSEVDFESFNDHMDECLKQYFEFSLYNFGLSGGNFKSDDMFNRQYTKTSYALNNNQKKIISIEDAEKQLEDYLINSVDECVRRFPNGNQFEITRGIADTDIIIAESAVSFVIKPNVKLHSEQSSFDVSDISIQVSVPLKRIFDVMHNVADLYKADKTIELQTYLSSLDFDFMISPYSDGSLLFYIIDKHNLINGQRYLFRFAVK